MIEILKSVVTEAGKTLCLLRNDKVFEGEWQGPQFKAKADLLIHTQLTDNLRNAFPEIPVVSEEDPRSLKHIGKGRYFIIDPVDGTASFIGGHNGFVTQVACVNNGFVEAAAICAPVSKDLYWAVRRKGAYCNSRRLKIVDPDRWNTLIDNYPEPRGITRDAFEELEFKTYLESGSISLKICRIADGSADMFFKNVPVQQWDVAAPHLVLAESGGSLLELAGKPIDYTFYEEYKGIVAANSKVHAKRLIAWYSKHIRQRDVP